MIEMTMDGIPVQIEEGSTILDAARFYGISIPTLCHFEGLSPYGACRLCVVEIGKGENAKLVSSCTYPAEQGLFVSWDGFNRTALSKTRDIFFKVRLWDDKKVISNLLSSYEKLPDEIQAELPMKRIWIVVPEEN